MIEKLVLYMLTVLFSAIYILKGREKTCPSPLLDPNLLILGITSALLAGFQYIEALPGVLSLHKNNNKESTITMIVILAILIDSIHLDKIVTFTLIFLTLRWFCIARKYTDVMVPMILSGVWPFNSLLYLLSIIASKKLRPKYVYVVMASILFMTLLYRFGLPIGSATISIMLGLGKYSEIPQKKNETLSPRQVLQ